MNNNNPFDVIIDSYLENNVGIDPGFLSESLAMGLRQNILRLQQADVMKRAGIGNSKELDQGQEMRSDKIYWMDKTHDNIYEQAFLAKVESFINYLNQTCYTGINDYEFHYAVYEEGNYYKKHRDQFNNDSDRKFSLINYLNDQWLDTDGGELLVYHEHHIQKILPHSQTGVFFKSSQMEHEVIAATRQRMSVTGWLKCKS